MYKYSSFVEYIQLNYIGLLRKGLEEFIECNELVIYRDNPSAMHRYDSYEIRSIKVTGVNYTKNQRDKVEFDVILTAEYIVSDDVLDSNTGFPPFYEKRESFRCGMTGSFKKGFKEKDDIEKVEDEKEERLTKSLVPVISTEEMDEYATKFLKEFCPEALEKPMKLPVDKMLSDKGIVVKYAPLPDNIFGKTYFAQDIAIVYKDDENGVFNFFGGPTEEIEVQPGTILINFDKALELPHGAYRNTIVHEAVHWFFHSNYFELKYLLNNELTCAVCCKGEADYENEDIAWMEWQARSIAPRVLMPKKMALQKWKEILEEVKVDAKEKDYSKAEVLEVSFKKFAKFFDVSQASARIRLKELGVTETEGLFNYVDGKKLKSYFYKKGTLGKNETFIITEDELCRLLRTNIFLQDALLKEKIFYINNMLVVNSPDFVDVKKYELTDYALSHIDECCLKFSIDRYGITSDGEITKNYLLSSINNRHENKDIMMEHAKIVLPLTNDSYSHYLAHKKDLPNTFTETFNYHYKKLKSKNRIHSYEDLSSKCDISDRTLRKYASGEVIPKRVEVLKICLGMKLSVPYIMDMLDKADCSLSFNNANNTLLLTTLISYPRVGLKETYKALSKVGMGELLEISDQWLEDEGLQ